MGNYQKAYLLLFNAVTDAIADMDALNFGKMRERLIAAQQQTEEVFLKEAENNTHTP